MPFVRPDVQAFLDQLKAMGGTPLNQLDAPTARQMFRAMGQMVELPRGSVARVEDLQIPTVHGHSVPARLYSTHAQVSEPAPVVVYYHGGGWVIGDLETHDSLCAETARVLGITVVSIDYRLAPEHRFPAAVEDCLAATQWIADSPAPIGHAVSGIVVAGDSAGGNLAAVCAQELTGKLPVPILAQWLIYPGTDMVNPYESLTAFAEGYFLSHDDMNWFQGSYIPGEADRSHTRASPILASTLEGQPPALVFTCGLDPLRDQGRAYAARLIQAGVELRFREAKGQIHGCFNLRAAIPSAQGDLAGCLADLKDLINEAQADATMAQAAGQRSQAAE